MIQVENTFNDSILTIKIGKVDGDNQIDIAIDNDIDFKPIVDELINLIPLGEQLQISFDELLDSMPNFDKLNLIKQTLCEIYTKFNNIFVVAPEPIGFTQDVDFNTLSSSEEDLPF